MENPRYEIYRKAIAGRRYDADKVAVLYFNHDLEAEEIAIVTGFSIEKASRLAFNCWKKSVSVK